MKWMTLFPSLLKANTKVATQVMRRIRGCSILAFMLLFGFIPKEAWAWAWVCAWTDHTSQTFYLGDMPVLTWDFNGDGHGASDKAFALYQGSTPYWVSGTANIYDEGANGSNWKWKTTGIRLSATGTWNYSLWLGWGSSVGDNGRYYNYGNNSWNEGSASLITSTITANSLTAPSGANATAAGTTVSLSWTRGAAGSTAKNTMIVRSTSATEPVPNQGWTYNSGFATVPSDTDHRGDWIYQGSANTYQDTGRTPGVKYYYYLYAENNAYYSAVATTSAIVPLAAPSPSSTVGDKSVTLTWSAITGATQGYKIYRSTTTTQPATPIGTTTASTYTYADTDSALSVGTMYYYWVEAHSADTNSVSARLSTTVISMPGITPGLPSLTPTAATLPITVNMNASASTLIKLEYGTTAVYGTTATVSPTSLGAGTTAGAVSSTLTGLSGGTTYYYRWTVQNAVGATTQTGSFTTPLATPVVSSATVTEASLSLAWGTVSGANSYIVQATPCAGTLATKIGNTELFDGAASGTLNNKTLANSWQSYANSTLTGTAAASSLTYNDANSSSGYADASGNPVAQWAGTAAMNGAALKISNIVISTISGNSVSFAFGLQFANTNDVVDFHYSFDNGTSWAKLETFTNSTTAWVWKESASIQLPATRTQPMMIAFVKTGANGIMRLDDLMFREDAAGAADWDCPEVVTRTGSTTTTTFSGLESDTVYYYRVLATNSTTQVDSAWSTEGNIRTEVGVLPPTVENPTATGITTSAAVLGATITDNGGDALTAAGIEYGTTAAYGTAVAAALVPAVGTSFTVGLSGLQPATRYYYRGYADNDEAGRGYSTGGEFYTVALKPTSAPSGLTISRYGTARLDLSWTAATGASGYLVVRSLTGIPAGVPVDGTLYTVGDLLAGGGEVVQVVSGSTSWNNSGLQPDTRYYYAVYAFAAVTGQANTYNYNSTPVTGSEATRAVAPTDTPVLIDVDAGIRRAAISWTPAATAEGTLVAVRQTTVTGGPNNPGNGTNYTASSVFGQGEDISGSTANGSYVVYIGSGGSVEVTGLAPDTDYRLELSAYNGTIVPAYVTGSTISFRTLPSTAPEIWATGVDEDYFLLNWSEAGSSSRYDVQVSSNPNSWSFTPASFSSYFHTSDGWNTLSSSTLQTNLTINGNPWVVSNYQINATGTSSVGGDAGYVWLNVPGAYIDAPPFAGTVTQVVLRIRSAGGTTTYRYADLEVSLDRGMSFSSLGTYAANNYNGSVFYTNVPPVGLSAAEGVIFRVKNTSTSSGLTVLLHELHIYGHQNERGHSLKVDSLAQGNTYYARVSAAGLADWSEVLAVRAGLIPAGVTATGVGRYGFTMDWSPTVTGATGYRVDVGTCPFGSAVEEVCPTETLGPNTFLAGHKWQYVGSSASAGSGGVKLAPIYYSSGSYSGHFLVGAADMAVESAQFPLRGATNVLVSFSSGAWNAQTLIERTRVNVYYKLDNEPWCFLGTQTATSTTDGSERAFSMSLPQGALDGTNISIRVSAPNALTASDYLRGPYVKNLKVAFSGGEGAYDTACRVDGYPRVVSGASTTTHAVTGLDPATPYFFRVQALDGADVRSDWVAGTTVTEDIIAPPVKVWATNEGRYELTVAWDAVAGAEAYNLEMTECRGTSSETLVAPAQQLGRSVGAAVDGWYYTSITMNDIASTPTVTLPRYESDGHALAGYGDGNTTKVGLFRAPFSTEDAAAVTISFTHSRRRTFAAINPGVSSVEVAYSLNGGSTWVTFHTTGDAPVSGSQNISTHLPVEALGQPSVMLRFQVPLAYISDSGACYGARLADVEVELATESVGGYELSSCLISTTRVSAASAREWVVDDLESDKQYYFRVQADDGVMAGGWTEGEGRTLAGVPPPEAIWAENVGLKRFDLLWDASTEAGVTYRVQVTECPDEDWTQTVVEPSATNRILTAEDDWTYIGGGSSQTLASGTYQWPAYVGSPEYSQVLAGANSPGLMSKVFSTHGATNAVVTFGHGRWYNASYPEESILTVEYSLDGGTTWNMLGLTPSASTAEYATLERTMALPAEALDQPSVRVRIVAENAVQSGTTSRGAAVRNATITLEGATGDYETAGCLVADVNNLEALTLALADLTPATPYWFRVQASDGISVGEWVEGTATTLSAPPAPTAIWAEDVVRQSFNLVWDAVSIAESYTVEISRNAGFTDLVGGTRTGLTDTVLFVDGLTANTLYYFRVCAVTEGETGAWVSNSATTMDSVRISGLRIENIGTNSFDIVWNYESGLAYTLAWTEQAAAAGSVSTFLTCPNQTLDRSDNGNEWFYIGGTTTSPRWWTGSDSLDRGHMLTYTEPGIQSRWFSTLGITNAIVRFNHGRFNSGNSAATVVTVQYSVDGGSSWATAGATQGTASALPTNNFALTMPVEMLEQESVMLRVSALAATGSLGAHLNDLEVELQAPAGNFSGATFISHGSTVGRYAVSGLAEGTYYNVQLTAQDNSSGNSSTDTAETGAATRVGDHASIASQGFDGWDDKPWAYTAKWVNLTGTILASPTTVIGLTDEDPLYGDKALRMAGASDGNSFGMVEFENLTGLANYRNKQLVIPFAAKTLTANDYLYFQASTNGGITWTAYTTVLDNSYAGTRIGIGGSDVLNQNWPYNRGLNISTRPKGNALVWDIPDDADELIIRLHFGGNPGANNTANYYDLDEIKLTGESAGPLPPSPVSAESQQNGNIKLEWTPNDDGDDVIILRAADIRFAPEVLWDVDTPPDGFEVLLNETSKYFPADVTEFMDNGVWGGTRYYYYFYSYDGATKSYRPTSAFAEAQGMIHAIASQGWDGWDINPWGYTSGWVNNPGGDEEYLPSGHLTFFTTWTNQVFVTNYSYYGAQALALQGSYGMIVNDFRINPTNAAVQFDNVDLSGYKNVRLQIHFAAEQVTGGNDLHIAISTNNGATWTMPEDAYGDGYGIVISDGQGYNNLYPTNWSYYYEQMGWPAKSPTPRGNPYFYDVPNSITQFMMRVMFFDANGSPRTNSFYFIDEVRLTGEPAMGTPRVEMQNITSNTFDAVWSAVDGADRYYVEVTKCDSDPWRVLLQESFVLNTLDNGWTGEDRLESPGNRGGSDQGFAYYFNANGRVLVSPELSAARQVQFYLRSASPPPASGWTLAVESAPDPATPDDEWISVTNITGDSGLTTSYQSTPFSVDLPERQHQYVRFKFTRTSSTPNLYLDDIAVLGGGDYTTAGCVVFSQVTSATNIHVSGTGIGASSNYFVRVQAEGTLPGGDTVRGPWGETGDYTAGNFEAWPDGFEMIRMKWTASAAAPLLVVYGGTDGIIGTPDAGVAYTVGNPIPGGGVVIANASGNENNFEHVVPFNAEASYAVFWKKGNYYEGRLNTNFWMGRYSSLQAEAFAYTNGTGFRVMGGNGKGWAGDWEVTSQPAWWLNDQDNDGGFVEYSAKLLATNQLYGAGGNGLVLRPGNYNAESVVALKRMFDAPYSASEQWWGMFTMQITYTGGGKWAGIQLLDSNGYGKISIGKLWNDGRIGLERNGLDPAIPNSYGYSDGDTHMLIFHWDGNKMLLAAYKCTTSPVTPILTPETPAPGQTGGAAWQCELPISDFESIYGLQLIAQNGSGAFLNNVYFDEIRVGPTWESLIGGGMEPPNPVVGPKARPDGNELVRLEWQKPAAVEAASSPTGKAIPAASGVLILDKATAYTDTDVPQDGRNYAAGATVGGATVVYSGTATELDHVVMPGSVHRYRFFSYSASVVYTNGTDALNSPTNSYYPVEMGTYGPTEYVNPFSYTNRTQITTSGSSDNGTWKGGNGFGDNWWSVHNGAYNMMRPWDMDSSRDPTFINVQGYPQAAGNLVVGDPAAIENNGVRLQMERSLENAYTASNTENFYIAFYMSYQYGGPNKWAGLSLLDGTAEKLFIGKGSGNDWHTLAVQARGQGASQNTDKIRWSGYAVEGYAAEGNVYSQNVYLYIAKYSFQDNEFYGKAYRTHNAGLIFPASEPTWEISVELDQPVQRISRIMLNAGALHDAGTIGKVWYDEIRYATNWLDLVAAVCPEGVEPGIPTPGTVYLGDSVAIQLESYPVGHGQQAEIRIDWDGTGESIYPMAWWKNSDNYTSTFWTNWVQMIRLGTIGGTDQGSIPAIGRVFARDGGMECEETSVMGPVQVLPLHPPTPAPIVTNAVQTNSALDLSWEKWLARDVLLIRFDTEEAALSAAPPVQGRAYYKDNIIGGGTVVYRGSLTNYTDLGLAPDTTYYYAFYSENYSYYSHAEIASGKTEPGEHEIVIDGKPYDWYGQPPEPWNSARWSLGEYIWKDKLNEEREDYSSSDIREFRVYADADWVYFLVSMRDITDTNIPHVAIGVDTRRRATSTSMHWLGDDANIFIGDDYFDTAASHYPEVQLGIHMVDGKPRVERFALDADEARWYTPPTIIEGLGTEAAIAAGEGMAVEVRVARADLGLAMSGSSVRTARFTVATFANNGVWNNLGAGTKEIYAETANNAVDAVSISPYRVPDNDYKLSSWDEDIADGDIDFWVDVTFSSDSIIENAKPPKPTLVSPKDKEETHGSPTLTWQMPTGASGKDSDGIITSYMLEISADERFGCSEESGTLENGTVELRVNLPTNTTSYRFATTSSQYWWRVRSRDNSGELSDYDIHEFKVVGKLDNEGPEAELLYVGTDVQGYLDGDYQWLEENYPDILRSVTDHDVAQSIANNTSLGFVVRWKDSSGVYATNQYRTANDGESSPAANTWAWNIDSPKGRVTPNWDLIAVDTVRTFEEGAPDSVAVTMDGRPVTLDWYWDDENHTNSVTGEKIEGWILEWGFNKPFAPSNTFATSNEDIVITNAAYQAFQMLSYDPTIAYYLTVSAEDACTEGAKGAEGWWENGTWASYHAAVAHDHSGWCKDGPNYARNVTTNQTLPIKVRDNDEIPPKASTELWSSRSMIITTNESKPSNWAAPEKELPKVTSEDNSSRVVYRVTDGDLRDHPLTFHFNIHDPYITGLQLPSNGLEAVTIGNILMTNTAFMASQWTTNWANFTTNLSSLVDSGLGTESVVTWQWPQMDKATLSSLWPATDEFGEPVTWPSVTNQISLLMADSDADRPNDQSIATEVFGDLIVVDNDTGTPEVQSSALIGSGTNRVQVGLLANWPLNTEAAGPAPTKSSIMANLTATTVTAHLSDGIQTDLIWAGTTSLLDYYISQGMNQTDYKDSKYIRFSIGPEENMLRDITWRMEVLALRSRSTGTGPTNFMLTAEWEGSSGPVEVGTASYALDVDPVTGSTNATTNEVVIILHTIHDFTNTVTFKLYGYDARLTSGNWGIRDMSAYGFSSRSKGSEITDADLVDANWQNRSMLVDPLIAGDQKRSGLWLQAGEEEDEAYPIPMYDLYKPERDGGDLIISAPYDIVAKMETAVQQIPDGSFESSAWTFADGAGRVTDEEGSVMAPSEWVWEQQAPAVGDIPVLSLLGTFPVLSEDEDELNIEENITRRVNGSVWVKGSAGLLVYELLRVDEDSNETRVSTQNQTVPESSSWSEVTFARNTTRAGITHFRLTFRPAAAGGTIAWDDFSARVITTNIVTGVAATRLLENEFDGSALGTDWTQTGSGQAWARRFVLDGDQAVCLPPGASISQVCTLPTVANREVVSISGDLWSRGGDIAVDIEFMDAADAPLGGETLLISAEDDWTLNTLSPVETEEEAAAKVRVTIQAVNSVSVYVDAASLIMMALAPEMDTDIINGIPEVTLSMKGHAYTGEGRLLEVSRDLRRTNMYKVVSSFSDYDQDRFNDNLTVYSTNYFTLYDDDDMPPQTGMMFGGPIGLRTSQRLPGAGAGRNREIRVTDRELSRYATAQGAVDAHLYIDIDGYDYSGWTTTELRLESTGDLGFVTKLVEDAETALFIIPVVTNGAAGLTSATNTFAWPINDIWTRYYDHFGSEVPVTNTVYLSMVDYDDDRLNDSLATNNVAASTVVFLDNDVRPPRFGYITTNKWLENDGLSFVGINGVGRLLSTTNPVPHRLETYPIAGEYQGQPVVYDSQLRKTAPDNEFFIIVNAGDQTESVNGRSSTGLRRGTVLTETAGNPFDVGTYDITNSFIAFKYGEDNALEDARHYRAEYSSSQAQTRFLAGTISNVWAWDSFDYEDMGYLLPPTEMLRLYELNFHAYDADDDRPGDQQSAILNIQNLLVRDNDTVAPVMDGILTVNGIVPDIDAVMWTNKPDFMVKFTPAVDGEPVIGDLNASGIGGYKVAVADASDADLSSLSAFNDLHPALRGMHGTGQPVAAPEGVLADAGLDQLAAELLASSRISTSRWELVSGAAADLLVTNVSMEGAYAVGLSNHVLRQTILLDDLPESYSQLTASVSCWIHSDSGAATPLITFTFRDINELPIEEYTKEITWIVDGTDPAAWRFLQQNEIAIPAEAVWMNIELVGGNGTTAAYFDDVQVRLNNLNAPEDEPDQPVWVPMAFRALEQGITTNYLFAVDRDNDRPGDQLSSEARQFFIAFDETPPTAVGNASQRLEAVTDTVDDPTTQFDLVWGVDELMGPDDPDSEQYPQWARALSSPSVLSPWQTYKIYYGTFDVLEVPEDDGPERGAESFVYTNFIETGVYTNWPSVVHTNTPADPSALSDGYDSLTNMTTTSIRLYDLDYDQDYAVIIVGVDSAGNEGPADIYSWATNNTIKFAVTQGVLRSRSEVLAAFGDDSNLEPDQETAAALYWIAAGPTNELGGYNRVTKEYDLIYWDAPSFDETTNSQWSYVGTVQSNWFTDASANSKSRGNVRFYRASYKDRWRRTNVVSGAKQRPLVSEDVYAMHNVIISEGINYVALHGLPYTNTFAGVFGTDTSYWPSAVSVYAGATYVEFYKAGYGSSVADDRYFFASDGEWYSVTNTTIPVTHVEQPPDFFTRGFGIGLPAMLPPAFQETTSYYRGGATTVNAMIWRPILKVPTNAPDGGTNFTHVIKTGKQNRAAPESVYNPVALNLPVSVHPRQLKLLEAGFVGTTSKTTADWLYIIDTSQKGMRDGQQMYYNTSLREWRFYNDAVVPEGYIKPNDILVIVSRNEVNAQRQWTWSYSPSDFYTLPTRWLGE